MEVTKKEIQLVADDLQKRIAADMLRAGRFDAKSERPVFTILTLL